MRNTLLSAVTRFFVSRHDLVPQTYGSEISHRVGWNEDSPARSRHASAKNKTRVQPSQEADKTLETKYAQNITSLNEKAHELRVVSILEITTQHGALIDKTQTREAKVYNLDAIISVGYSRLKS